MSSGSIPNMGENKNGYRLRANMQTWFFSSFLGGCGEWQQHA